jgi:hypothetical protein
LKWVEISSRQAQWKSTRAGFLPNHGNARISRDNRIFGNNSAPSFECFGDEDAIKGIVVDIGKSNGR